MFNGVTLARPPGADMIVSYHSANWTSVAFCLIGMFKSTFHLQCSYENYDRFFKACILSILFFRGVGVVGQHAPKTTLAEEQEQGTFTLSKDLLEK